MLVNKMETWLVGRRGIAALLAVVIGIVAGCGVILLKQSEQSARVYTMAQVVAGLQQHPKAWGGRTILVRATVLAQADTGCLVGPNLMAGPSSHPRHCFNHRISWIYLGPASSRESLSVLIRSPDARVMSFRAVSAPHVRTIGTPTLAAASAPLTSTLSVLLHSGANQPSLRRERRVLPAVVYNLPALGPVFERLFPQTMVTAVTLRVRLSAIQDHLCVGNETAGSCTDGTLLSP